MSKKNNKGNKPGEYPTEGVNEIWDYLFKLDGMKSMLDSIPDENQRMGILNYAAGMSEKYQKEIEEFRKNLKPEDAEAAIHQMSRDTGMDAKSADDLISGVKAMRKSAKETIKEASRTGVSVAEMIKKHKEKKI